MSRVVNRIVINEPHGITPDLVNYKSALSRAFNFYNQDNDKKDARVYLKSYIKHTGLSVNIDSVPDNEIITTYGWLSRMVMNGNILIPRHNEDLDNYIKNLSNTKVIIKVVEDKPARPSVRDYMQEKIAEVIGDLEGALDTFIKEEKDTVSGLGKNNLYYEPSADGIYVYGVDQVNNPLSLKTNDVIVSLNGIKITEQNAIEKLEELTKPNAGKLYEIELLRDKKSIKSSGTTVLYERTRKNVIKEIENINESQIKFREWMLE